MKNFKLIIITLILFSCSKSGENTFKNESFSFKKPLDWNSVENMSDTIVYYEKITVDEATRAFNPVISVSGGLNEENVQTDFLESTEKILSEAIQQFSVKYSGTYKNSKNKRLIYTGIMGDVTLQWDMIFYVKSKTSYILTYTCLPEEYEVYIEDFYKVADSFRLK